MEFDLSKLVRENIKGLLPYSSARGEFGGDAEIFLDANENAFGSPLSADYSRYPDPLQTLIKGKLANAVGVSAANIFVGNGSDEAIDLLIRIFCRPGIDNILICPPTYGMYEVSANINDIKVKRADLCLDYELDLESIGNTIDEATKLIFLCSPNNPTGNSLKRNSILKIAELFCGIVIVDEAYVHFSERESLIPEIKTHPNIVVLQTFSKAWGLAGLRVGKAFANAPVIDLMNRVKPPYNVSHIAQKMILEAFENRSVVEARIAEIVKMRGELAGSLAELSFVDTVYPSEANFLLVKMTNPNKIYDLLLIENIVVRNRSTITLCEGCLRITIGTPDENATLIKALRKYEKGFVH
ncbi:MAG: histidinol-phosphate transaminase [Acidobacteriota bacterium]